jgi:ectoine hydroxylase-related dioxygenase (phytanoyl-CoA dioxygenase family)
MLTPEQLESYHRDGHATVPGIFFVDQMDRAKQDAAEWGADVVSNMKPHEAEWYVESGSDSDRPVLRKLDNPVFHRPIFRQLATHTRLVEAVEQILGSETTAFFSQIFFKPPEVGGEKPIHQDNFYFGPDDDNAMVTAWVAMDDATIDNGCLYFGNGSHLRGLLGHHAPEDRPFNLSVDTAVTANHRMSPAPVAKGGVSFHHGLTLHQSSANKSQHSRCAVAIHYLRSSAELSHPALPYDESLFVPIRRSD